MIVIADISKDIVLSTFCEGGLEGVASRAFYKKMGTSSVECSMLFLPVTVICKLV